MHTHIHLHTIHTYIHTYTHIHTNTPPIIREKKILALSDNYGRELTGVQRLQKKHQRFDGELKTHETTLQVHIRMYACYIMSVGWSKKGGRMQ